MSTDINFLDAKSAAFFASYNFDICGPSIDASSQALYYDLHAGLEIQRGEYTQEMLPTWILAQKPCDKQVIVLDAGGTNFRSYLIEIKNGEAKILKEKKERLPALEHHCNAEEFFALLGEKIAYLKDQADTIHFCFAYALEMTPEKDARVLRMSKEVLVEGIVGKLVGASLFAALKKQGWKKLQKVSVINDTAAALLSGLSLNKNFSSYIGMILGTGFNIAYEEAEHIEKLAPEQELLKQIVVCETAKTNKIAASDFDRELQKMTSDKTLCKLEKMCSGAYLGDLISIAVKHACTDGIFSKQFSAKFACANFNFQAINEFLKSNAPPENEVVRLIKNAAASETDIYFLKQIARQMINRTARIVTAALTAVALKTKAGSDPHKPLCIVAEGTTFAKADGLKDTVLRLLKENLRKKHGIHFELYEIPNAVAIGSAFLS